MFTSPQQKRVFKKKLLRQINRHKTRQIHPRSRRGLSLLGKMSINHQDFFPSWYSFFLSFRLPRTSLHWYRRLFINVERAQQNKKNSYYYICNNFSAGLFFSRTSSETNKAQEEKLKESAENLRKARQSWFSLKILANLCLVLRISPTDIKSFQTSTFWVLRSWESKVRPPVF